MKILIVSPHPDDETLGAGGSLLKFVDEGHTIYWLNITDMKEEYGYSKEIILCRKEEIEKVRNTYGIKEMFNLQMEPANLEKINNKELIEKTSRIISDIKPQMLILPYKNDIHSDHKITFNAVYASSKSFRYPFIESVLCMEILSETDYALPEESFFPNLYIDISDYIERKIEIMKTYKSEIGVPPFPRSEDNIRSLARYRGSSCGTYYAEAFKLMKGIIK